MEIYVQVSDPQDTPGDIEGLLDAVAFHLRKTQNQRYAGKEITLSSLVSLSCNFLWTVHNTCKKGRIAKENQIAGLAIFQVSDIKEIGTHLWRVKDLLAYFDRNLKSQSYKIDKWARKWAENADEYLCWDIIPKECLFNFVPYKRLAQLSDRPEEIFLRSDFIASKGLGHFKRYCDFSPQLTIDQYSSRISDFLMAIMDRASFRIDAEILIDSMVKVFLNSKDWGYVLLEGGPRFEQTLRRIVASECLWAMSFRSSLYQACDLEDELELHFKELWIEYEYPGEEKEKFEACKAKILVILERARSETLYTTSRRDEML